MPTKDLTANDIELTEDKEFRDLIPPVTDSENDDLAKSVDKLGRFMDPIRYWNNGKKNLIVDGYRRHKLWCSLPEDTPVPPPAVEEMLFPDRAAAMEWMLLNQLSRRNLNPQQAKMLRGRLYNSIKAKHGGNRTGAGRKTSQSESENLSETLGINQVAESATCSGEPEAAQEVARQTGVSPRTVRADAAYVDALDAIGVINPSLKSELLSGKFKVSEKDVLSIAKLDKDGMAAVRRNLKWGKPWNAAPQEEPAAEESPTVILDALNRPVPKTLIECHAASAEIQSAGTKLDQVKRLVEDIAEKPGGHFIPVQQIQIALKDVKGKLTHSRYYTDCPRCQGKPKKGCDRCDGVGFIPYAKRGQLSDEDRAYLGVEK